ncbi:hypothetical protein GALMADRAFT_278463 [Galerina marginata CBS 339.88]|uniref:MYND-type domain-containing protein n=1 Tax=Galerina marginata (strain CBS 339.88) TaxID=685588 RepID=A0A067T713_GALM3|nr:hypothetical protein GALMADRAFT_278463 [Galerina marginata CBS 339.88]
MPSQRTRPQSSRVMNHKEGSNLSEPLLPRSFIDDLERTLNVKFQGVSEVYKEDRHSFRLQMRDWSQPVNASPNSSFGAATTADGAYTANRTLLHLGAMFGDVLSVCELIYCGATPDMADQNGFTAVFISLAQAARFHQSDIAHRLSYTGAPLQMHIAPVRESMDRQKALRCLSCVTRILIEQLVDVNQTRQGVSLLQLACIAKDWETVKLLLRHGAVDSVSTSRDSFRSAVPSSTDRNKVSQLLKEHAQGKTENWQRPPRKCPCWSGKDVVDCHGKEGARISYPSDYVCVCGSTKIYKKCCSRKRTVYESWDFAQNRILQDFDLLEKQPKEFYDNLDQNLGELNVALERLNKMGLSLKDVGIPLPGTSQSPEEATAFGHKAMKHGLVDPAFGYAMVRFGKMYPVPVRGIHSRTMMERSQESWNKLIDEYIATGTDKRSVFDIEAAAKIAVWNGPYVRRCEGPACGKLEFRDVEKLQQCTTCKLSSYCGRACQKADWESHKTVCNTQSQEPQRLPSQMTLMNLIANPEWLMD